VSACTTACSISAPRFHSPFQIIARAAQVGITLAPQQILSCEPLQPWRQNLTPLRLKTLPQAQTGKIARVSREQYQLDAAPQAT